MFGDVNFQFANYTSGTILPNAMNNWLRQLSIQPCSGVSVKMKISMKNIIKLLLVLISLGLAGAIAPCFSKEVSAPSNDIDGFYDSMALPTPAEKVELQKNAMSQGVDLDMVLKNLRANDQKAWRGVFRLSTNFTYFDRSAEVYGYQLFTAFSYFIDSASEASFAKLLNEQPPKIKQRIRDFLYYEAANSNSKVMKNNERLLRLKLALIFPASYLFASNDPFFEKTPLR